MTTENIIKNSFSNHIQDNGDKLLVSIELFVGDFITINIRDIASKLEWYTNYGPIKIQGITSFAKMELSPEAFFDRCKIAFQNNNPNITWKLEEPNNGSRQLNINWIIDEKIMKTFIIILYEKAKEPVERMTEMMKEFLSYQELANSLKTSLVSNTEALEKVRSELNSIHDNHIIPLTSGMDSSEKYVKNIYDNHIKPLTNRIESLERYIIELRRSND